MPEKKTKETRGMKLFRKKTERSLSRIQQPEDFRQSDKQIDWVFKVAEFLFEKDLDQYNEAWLVRHGGRLTAVYAYLGNYASRARAERDVYEQKRDEVLGELMLELLDGDYKVTEARSRAKVEVAEIDDLVVEKEMEKNNYEHLLNAIDKLVSFMQSAIRVRESERYRGKMEQ